MISNRNNLLTAYFHPNNPSNSIQHQRSTIRRSNVLTIKPSSLEFNESLTNNIHQQKIKRDLDRQSPVFLIRRDRPSIENRSPHQQPSDITDVFGNQLQLTHPPQLISRNKSPRISSLHSKPLNYSKTINTNTIKHISKFSHSLQTPIWTPTLTDKNEISPRPSRSKSLSLKHYHHHHHHQLQIEKTNSISGLYIAPKSINNDYVILKKTNIKNLVDDWEDPKSNVAVLSDEDDSIVTNCNTPILTYNPQNNIQKSDHFTLNKTNLERKPYSFYLPSVTEDINDEN